MGFLDFITSKFFDFLSYTGFANATLPNLIMIVVGGIFIWLAIRKDFEPLLLVPIGLGIILGNIPFRADAGLEIGLYEDNSVLNIDRLLGTHQQPEVGAHRCCGTVWYLRCLHGGFGPWL